MTCYFLSTFPCLCYPFSSITSRQKIQIDELFRYLFTARRLRAGPRRHRRANGMARTENNCFVSRQARPMAIPKLCYCFYVEMNCYPKREVSICN